MRKRKSAASEPLLGPQSKISIATAIPVVGCAIWLAWYGAGLVRDVDELKADLTSIRSTLDRIENRAGRK